KLCTNRSASSLQNGRPSSPASLREPAHADRQLRTSRDFDLERVAFVLLSRVISQKLLECLPRMTRESSLIQRLQRLRYSRPSTSTSATFASREPHRFMCLDSCW